MHAKLGLEADAADGDALIADLLSLIGEQRVDYTSCLRSLSSVVRGETGPARSLFAEPDAFDTWSTRWLDLLGVDRVAIAAAMDRANPIYIPRNHLVEEVLDAATAGDLAPFEELLELVTHPFEQLEGRERYESGAPIDAPPHRTFCGT